MNVFIPQFLKRMQWVVISELTPIIKGMVTPNNTKLLNKFEDSKRIPTGQKVIVFGFKDGKNCLIVFLKNDGTFDLKGHSKKYGFTVEDIAKSMSELAHPK